MANRMRSRLSIAELLAMIALAAIALQVWRTWGTRWQREEYVLAVTACGAWLAGVLGSRILGWMAVGPTVLIVAAAVAATARWLELSWDSVRALAWAAAALALVTAPLPQMLSWIGHRAARLVAKPGWPRWAVIATAATIAGATLAIWQPWQPPISTTRVLRQLEDPSRAAGWPRNVLHLGAVSPGGESIAVYRRWEALVLDARTGKATLVPPTWDGPVQPLAFSHDGRSLAGMLLRDVGPHRMIVHSVPALTLKAQFDLVSRPRSCQFLPDGNLLIGFAPDFQRLVFEIWQIEPQVRRVRQWSFDAGPHAKTGPYSSDGTLTLVHPREKIGEDLPWQLWQIDPPKKLGDLPADVQPNYVAGGVPLLRCGDWLSAGQFTWNRSSGARHDRLMPSSKRPNTGELVSVLPPDMPSLSTLWRLKIPGAVFGWEVRTPFWRLPYLNRTGARLQLVPTDRETPTEWLSDPVPWNNPKPETVMSVDGSAVAAIDEVGQIVVWRIHRSPRSHEFQPAK